jgi:hypothetical protein
VRKGEQVARLEAAGFALHRMATELRDARQRFPVRDDLSPRLDAAEEEARTLAGEIASRLRDLDEAVVYGGGPPA